MKDFHKASAYSHISPAVRCFAIEPDDVAELPIVTEAIYIGKAGDVTLCASESDADVTFRSVPVGAMIDVRAIAVRAVGTTASAIVGLARWGGLDSVLAGGMPHGLECVGPRQDSRSSLRAQSGQVLAGSGYFEPPVDPTRVSAKPAL